MMIFVVSIVANPNHFEVDPDPIFNKPYRYQQSLFKVNVFHLIQRLKPP